MGKIPIFRKPQATGKGSLNKVRNGKGHFNPFRVILTPPLPREISVTFVTKNAATHTVTYFLNDP